MDLNLPKYVNEFWGPTPLTPTLIGGRNKGQPSHKVPLDSCVVRGADNYSVGDPHKKKADTNEEIFAGTFTIDPGPPPCDPITRTRPSKTESNVAKLAMDVIDLDLLPAVNSKEHSTEKYAWQRKSKLVARRGIPVEICLTTTERFVALKHAVYIEMILDRNAHNAEYRQKLRLETSDLFTDVKRHWSAKLNKIEGNHMYVTITVPFSAGIGPWSIVVSTGVWSEAHQTFSERMSTFSKVRREEDYAIYVIFNALRNDDTVFLQSKEQRELLIDRELDITYWGLEKGESSYESRHAHWMHSQFDEATMVATMELIGKLAYDHNSLHVAQRGSIVQVSRKMSYAISKFLLEGNWDEELSEHLKENEKLPTSWHGTAEIVAVYLRTRSRVLYGQCFVFASVFVTLMRCLGVASRSVTCIRSAHDRDRSLTADLEYRNGERIRGGGESVWNFHVWTEIWCRRNDLPIGFDGWQVVDATPQEASNGFNQCGPMPVKAVKMGRLKLGYDGWFIYGEVNADVVHWYYDDDHNLVDYKHDLVDAGRALLTANVPGVDEPLVITGDYKELEGTPAERSTHMLALSEVREITEVRNAEREARHRKLYENGKHLVKVKDVLVDVVDIEQVEFGSKIVLTIVLKSTANTDRTVHIVAMLAAEDHRGRVEARIKEYNMTQHLVPEETKQLTYEVPARDYAKHINTNQIMNFSVSATVMKTKQMIHKYDKFNIIGSAITFHEVPTRGSLMDTFTATLYFRNPLQIPLDNVQLFLHSQVTAEPKKVERFPSTVKESGKVRIRCKVRAVAQGDRIILASLNCDQLNAMTISRRVFVSPA